MIVYPPPATGGTQNLIHYVRLELGERVQWHYAHTLNGTYVSGYDIIKPEVKCDCGKCDESASTSTTDGSGEATRE